MQIKFNQQDIIDSICVLIASRENFNIITGSHPHLVENVRLKLHPFNGIEATAQYGFRTHHLDKQEIIDAVAVYLSTYHSFRTESLMVNLGYNGHVSDSTKQFSSDISVV